MRRWKILLAGAPGAGKSTLCRTLLRKDRPVVKTQSPEYHGSLLVDLPGEYLTIPRLRTAFLASVQDVDIVLYLAAANASPPDVPAGLLQTTPGLTLRGVVTKVDEPDADSERTQKHMALVGLPAPFFEICSLNGNGMAPLRQWLDAQTSGAVPSCETESL